MSYAWYRFPLGGLVRFQQRVLSKRVRVGGTPHERALAILVFFGLRPWGWLSHSPLACFAAELPATFFPSLPSFLFLHHWLGLTRSF